MVIEMKLTQKEMEPIIRQHVGTIVSLDKFPSVHIITDYGGGYTVTLKDQAEIDAEAKRREADRARLAKQDAQRAEVAVAVAPGSF